MPQLRPLHGGLTHAAAVAASFQHVGNGWPETVGLELHHPLVKDDQGRRIPVRLVNYYWPIVAVLEASAALDAGREVAFTHARYRFVAPCSIEQRSDVTIALILQRLSGPLAALLALARHEPQQLSLIARALLCVGRNDWRLEPPIALTVLSIECNSAGDDARLGCRFDGEAFPGVRYSETAHPELAAGQQRRP